MLAFLKKLLRKKKSAGVYIASTASAVILYSNGAHIAMTPELAVKLAGVLPRYAETSRALKGPRTTKAELL